MKRKRKLESVDSSGKFFGRLITQAIFLALAVILFHYINDRYNFETAVMTFLVLILIRHD